MVSLGVVCSLRFTRAQNIIRPGGLNTHLGSAITVRKGPTRAHSHDITAEFSYLSHHRLLALTQVYALRTWAYERFFEATFDSRSS